MLSLSIIPFSLLLCILLNLPVQAKGPITFPKIEKKFEKLGIGKDLSRSSLTNLESLLKNEEQNYQSHKNKKERKLIRHAQSLLAKISNLSSTKSSHYYLTVKRMLYSLWSDDGRKGKGVRTTPGKVNLPEYISPRRIIGMNNAKKEANNIYNPSTKKFFTTEQIRKMSYQDFSGHDIAPFHLMWNTNSYINNHPTPFKDIIHWVNKTVNEKIKDKISDKYDLNKAAKVVFFKSIKKTSTAPKIKVKDAFGEKWKMKWGLENQTEVITNRLYLEVGAKFSDINFSMPKGSNGSTLILQKYDDGCTKIATFSNLKKCLLKSKYKFNISPYVKEIGKLTPNNIDKILKDYPKTYNKKYQRNFLIGRNYLTFTSSQLEFKSSKVMMRYGVSAVNNLQSQNDRVLRGLLLFHMWTGSYDIKELNNKGIILKNYKDKKNSYTEFFHDLGGSLGAPGEAGHINLLTIGNDFLKRKDNYYQYQGSFFYFPSSLHKASFMDLLWMAKKIVRVKESKIKEIINTVNWPDFAKKAAIYKLTSRRNQIAKVFKLTELLDTQNITPLNIKVSLNDYDNLKKKYQITKKELEEYEDLPSSEWVVKNGQIISCKKSVIVNILEKTDFPEGLSRKQKRKKDKKPLPFCKYSN